MNNNFENYLRNLKISSKSLRNYRSDAMHFFNWAKNSLKSTGVYIEDILETSPFLSFEFVASYLADLRTNGIPDKTINRRLSTLRHLSRFLIDSAILESDFMSEVSNVNSAKLQSKATLSAHPSLAEFQAHLESQNVSKNTLKNYMSDVRQFFAWLEENHAHFT